MRQLTKSVIWLLAWLPAAAYALDYRSVSVPRSVLYDAPSANAKKLFVVSQFYPVEVIVDLGGWVKVRDKTGELAWIDSRQLAPKRTVLALDAADIRGSADASAPVVFRVEKDVALELVESAGNGWIKVRHRDGLVGFILSSQVWGI
jgi:SH3-like domain-containing protein